MSSIFQTSLNQQCFGLITIEMALEMVLIMVPQKISEWGWQFQILELQLHSKWAARYKKCCCLLTFFVVWDPGWFFIELRVVPQGSTSLKTLNKIEKWVKPKELNVSFSLFWCTPTKTFSSTFVFLSMAPFDKSLTIWYVVFCLMPTSQSCSCWKKTLWLKFT